MNILVSFIFISSFTFFEDYAFLFLISALFAYIYLFSNIKKRQISRQTTHHSPFTNNILDGWHDKCARQFTPN